MKISVRNLEPTKVKLTITVDPEEFNPYLDAARKEIAKQVNIPGFRKGHVPGKIIDQRIGFAAVAGEAVNNGVPELYSKALEEKKIHPMSQPEIDVQEVPESAKDETKLKFTATVERRPDIELPELDGLEIDVPKAQVTDEDVNTASNPCASASAPWSASTVRLPRATSRTSTSTPRSTASPSTPRKA